MVLNGLFEEAEVQLFADYEIWEMADQTSQSLLFQIALKSRRACLNSMTSCSSISSAELSAGLGPPMLGGAHRS